MKWKQATWVSFDTETSGKYPLDAEICEIAAVKWQSDQIIDKFQSLVRVSKPMSSEVIAIHGITNEMLEPAPAMNDVIVQFSDFIKDSYLVAHHAPFDLGFLCIEFEKSRLSLPENPVFCTSLLSRTLFSDSINHKLQTLIEYFKFTKGTAHRALDDSMACLQVALKCFEKIGADAQIEDILRIQRTPIYWLNYSIESLKRKSEHSALVESLKKKSEVQIVYQGGSRPGEPRTVTPLGLVRNPNGDFLVALDSPDQIPKRYFLNKITASRL